MALRPARALRQVRAEFERLSGQMQLMHGACQIKPNDVNVISISSNGPDVSVTCAPVVCLVPERASHDRADLYVVFTGSITFNGIIEGALTTVNYGTNFGYFAVGDSSASHVLGGHYDFSPDEPAHPRAHLQLRSQASLYAHAQENFRSISGIGLHGDLMKDILSRVRPPSAQMDFLSFMLQVAADHLVDEKSAARTIATFESLSMSCQPVLGYHAGIAQCGCHRAPHWYPTR